MYFKFKHQGRIQELARGGALHKTAGPCTVVLMLQEDLMKHYFDIRKKLKLAKEKNITVSFFLPKAVFPFLTLLQP